MPMHPLGGWVIPVHNVIMSRCSNTNIVGIGTIWWERMFRGRHRKVLWVYRRGLWAAWHVCIYTLAQQEVLHA